jgi:hypothetical protein
MPAGVVAVHTGRGSSRRVALSRSPENEVRQTRSQAFVTRRTSTSGLIAGESFTSMLKRASGQAMSKSAMTGIGSVPPILAPATWDQVSSAILPVLSVTRSSVRSWNATTTPSEVAFASVSR